jgi:ribosomal 50S subunit-recycling heat shock protein
MRLDLFLKVSRLVLRRSAAQELCDQGLVKVNGQTAKSSKEIKAGDRLEIRRGASLVRAQVLEIPQRKQLSKSEAGRLVNVVESRITEGSLNPGSE